MPQSLLAAGSLTRDEVLVDEQQGYAGDSQVARLSKVAVLLRSPIGRTNYVNTNSIDSARAVEPLCSMPAGQVSAQRSLCGHDLAQTTSPASARHCEQG